MGKQGNMLQIEKDKISKKEHNEMEINNMPDKDLMILKMLPGLKNKKTLKTSTKSWKIQRTRAEQYNN